ncbi:MFS transporter [Brachybacterium kimchii]|uniref:MFS transporter n=1 Tax=Brachybacterium kimchii TaxID=2942909 RepID=A0ABY4N701_9MICO|nr:MFS transporter [Brachybacterium kimchii]UQN29180.1 MFS transporter [Brachybacterium kimchii]
MPEAPLPTQAPSTPASRTTDGADPAHRTRPPGSNPAGTVAGPLGGVTASVGGELAGQQPATGTGSASEPPRVGIAYFVGMFLAQFGICAALITPVMVTMQLKAQEISPENPAAVIGAVLPVGAIGALVANPLAGALSDRTRTRWGRRRPWLVGGIVGLTLALVGVALSTSVLALTVFWLIAQVVANATLAALVASFADNVPSVQRGRGSSIINIGQNVAILAGTYLSVGLVDHLAILFIAPGVLGIVLVAIYAAVSRDELPAERPAPLLIRTLIASFWTNPIKHRDFGLAWWSRFFIILGSFMFTTFRLLYMQQHLGLDAAHATRSVALGVLLYTIALLVATSFVGAASDRLGRRKIFVIGSALLFAVGILVLAFAGDVAHFYLAEIILGFAYGMYMAVDVALVVDVLPDPEKPGKDLGVINIANALPQSFASPFALVFLGLGVSGTDNYTAMLIAAAVVTVLGALAIVPIRKVR